VAAFPPETRTRRTTEVVGSLAFAAAVLGLLLACFPYFEAVRNANELPRVAQAVSMATEGRLDLGRFVGAGFDLGPDLARGPDGRLYPNKPPGVSAVGAAAVVAARAAGAPPKTLRQATFLLRLAAAMFPVALFVFAAHRRLRSAGVFPARARAALWAVVFGTPLFAYGRLAYGHALAAVLLFLGISLCARALAEARPARALTGGFVAGLSVVADYGAVFAAVPIGLVLVSSLRTRAYFVTAAAVLGAAVPMAALAGYHHVAFGSPLATGYHAVTTPAFAAKHAVGFVGLSRPTAAGFWRQILDPGFGLLAWAPAAVPAVVGLAVLALRPGPLREEARIHLGIAVVYGLVVSGLVFDGGWRVGPRYMVVAFPGLALGLARALAWARTRRAAAVLLAAIFVYSWIVNALAAGLWPHFDPAAVRQPVFEVLVPLWRGGFAPYGLPEGPSVVLAAVLVVGLFDLLPALAWADPEPPPSRFFGRRAAPSRPPAAAAEPPPARGAAAFLRALALPPAPDGRGVLLAVTAGVALGAVLVAALHLVSPHPRAAANLAYIERVYEPPRHGPAPDSRPLP